MNNTFKANLIKTLANKKGNKGFTLIELLVVVIIIGVLAAIALPNLLAQVGKARESEAKNTLGAMNRAQQAYFIERGSFAGTFDALEVPVGNEKFYGIFTDDETPGTVGATGVNRTQGTNAIIGTDIGAVANAANGTRDYAAGINYNDTDRTFSAVVCRSMDRAKQYVLHEPPGLNATDFRLFVPAAVSGLTSAGLAVDNTEIASCDLTDGLTEETR